MIGYGRGGGGGFGGVPYRSSHQQGQDGSSNRNGRGRGRGGRGRGGGRQQQRSKRNNNNNISPLSFQAELSIPSQQRGIIIGRGGTTIKWLKKCTGAKIFVPSVQQQQRQSRRGRHQEQHGEHTGAPQTAASSTNDASTNNQSTASAASTQQQQPHQTQEEHPVRVNTNELSNLLHAFSEISTLLSSTTTSCTDNNNNIQDGNDGDLLLGENNDVVHCIVKMKSHGAKKQPGAQPQRVDVKVDGHLFLHHNHGKEATHEGITHNTNNGSTNGQSQKNNENRGSLEHMILFQGTLMNNNSNNAHSSTQDQLLVYKAYCIPTPSLLEEDIATIVDNVRFVNNPSMGDDDLCQWFYREVPLLLVKNNNNSNSNLNNEEEQEGDGMNESSSDCCVTRRLVFVFGPEAGNPLSICQAIVAEQSQRSSVAGD